MLEDLPPGYRFHPTDEELVSYYLRRKVIGKPIVGNSIQELKLYECEPWSLPEHCRLSVNEWYFFSSKGKKYGSGSRANRATKEGYWKATGKDRTIKNKSKVVGMKKTLVFYIGRAPQGTRTDWVMHEYRLGPDEAHLNKDDFVLCRVYNKKNGKESVQTDEQVSSDGEEDTLPMSAKKDTSPVPSFSTQVLALKEYNIPGPVVKGETFETSSHMFKGNINGQPTPFSLTAPEDGSDFYSLSTDTELVNVASSPEASYIQAFKSSSSPSTSAVSNNNKAMQAFQVAERKGNDELLSLLLGDDVISQDLSTSSDKQTDFYPMASNADSKLQQEQYYDMKEEKDMMMLLDAGDFSDANIDDLLMDGGFLTDEEEMRLTGDLAATKGAGVVPPAIVHRARALPLLMGSGSGQGMAIRMKMAVPRSRRAVVLDGVAAPSSAARGVPVPDSEGVVDKFVIHEGVGLDQLKNSLRSGELRVVASAASVVPTKQNVEAPLDERALLQSSLNEIDKLAQFCEDEERKKPSPLAVAVVHQADVKPPAAPSQQLASAPTSLHPGVETYSVGKPSLAAADAAAVPPARIDDYEQDPNMMWEKFAYPETPTFQPYYNKQEEVPFRTHVKQVASDEHIIENKNGRGDKKGSSHGPPGYQAHRAHPHHPPYPPHHHGFPPPPHHLNQYAHPLGHPHMHGGPHPHAEHREQQHYRRHQDMDGPRGRRGRHRGSFGSHYPPPPVHPEHGGPSHAAHHYLHDNARMFGRHGPELHHGGPPPPPPPHYSPVHGYPPAPPGFMNTAADTFGYHAHLPQHSSQFHFGESMGAGYYPPSNEAVFQHPDSSVAVGQPVFSSPSAGEFKGSGDFKPHVLSSPAMGWPTSVHISQQQQAASYGQMGGAGHLLSAATPGDWHAKKHQNAMEAKEAFKAVAESVLLRVREGGKEETVGHPSSSPALDSRHGDPARPVKEVPSDQAVGTAAAAPSHSSSSFSQAANVTSIAGDVDSGAGSSVPLITPKQVGDGDVAEPVQGPSETMVCARAVLTPEWNDLRKGSAASATASGASAIAAATAGATAAGVHTADQTTVAGPATTAALAMSKGGRLGPATATSPRHGLLASWLEGKIPVRPAHALEQVVLPLKEGAVVADEEESVASNAGGNQQDGYFISNGRVRTGFTWMDEVGKRRGEEATAIEKRADKVEGELEDSAQSSCCTEDESRDQGRGKINQALQRKNYMLTKRTIVTLFVSFFLALFNLPC